MKIKKLLILICSLILFSISNLFAQESETIFHQGILTDDTGEAVEDGSFIFTFRIYNEETGGESLWMENQILQVNSGIFNAHLGSEENLALTFDEKYWIGVTIDGGDELEPRMPLSAVPYAMHALSVKDGVITGAKLDPDVIQGGSNVSVERDQDTHNFIISADTPEGGLLSVHSDNSLLGDGTDESPLGLDYSELVISEENLEAGSVTGDKIANDALQGGANVSVERDEDTQNFIISADTPEGGLLSVHSDNSLLGDGTNESPLGLDYSELVISEGNLEAGVVTGEKLNDNAILSGDNVMVDRDGNNNFVISATSEDVDVFWELTHLGIRSTDDRVGIGTNPLHPLSVRSGESTSASIWSSNESNLIRPLDLISARVGGAEEGMYNLLSFRYNTGVGSGGKLLGDIGTVLTSEDQSSADFVFHLRNPVHPGNQIERMRLTSDGFLGIGTSTPGSMLDVNGDLVTSGNIATDGELRANADLSSVNSYLRFRDSSGNAGPRFYHDYINNYFWLMGADKLYSDMDMFLTGDANIYGNLGVGVEFDIMGNLHIRHEGPANPSGRRAGMILENEDNNSAWQFYVSRSTEDLRLYFAEDGFEGDFYGSIGGFDHINGEYYTISDVSLKQNIQPLSSVLQDIKMLRPQSYSFITDGSNRQQFGFIAQDLNEIFPHLVKESGEEDVKMVNYSQFGVIAIQAIQEQQEIIEAQQQELDRIKQVLREAGYNLD